MNKVKEFNLEIRNMSIDNYYQDIFEIKMTDAYKAVIIADNEELAYSENRLLTYFKTQKKYGLPKEKLMKLYTRMGWRDMDAKLKILYAKFDEVVKDNPGILKAKTKKKKLLKTHTKFISESDIEGKGFQLKKLKKKSTKGFKLKKFKRELSIKITTEKLEKIASEPTHTEQAKPNLEHKKLEKYDAFKLKGFKKSGKKSKLAILPTKSLKGFKLKKIPKKIHPGILKLQTGSPSQKGFKLKFIKKKKNTKLMKLDVDTDMNMDS